MEQFKTKCSVHNDTTIIVNGEDYCDVSQDYYEAYKRYLCIDVKEEDTEEGLLLWLDKSETERLVVYLQEQLKTWK